MMYMNVRVGKLAVDFRGRDRIFSLYALGKKAKATITPLPGIAQSGPFVSNKAEEKDDGQK